MGKEPGGTAPHRGPDFCPRRRVLGFPLSRLCFEGPAETLNDTANAQPAILTASVAALRVLEEMGRALPALPATAWGIHRAGGGQRADV